jgi:nicotinamide-nucleotide amidase
MRVEIICTGDEVLSGKTINTNYSHMARRLQEVGIDVLWGTTVGDDRESLIQAFNLAGARADAVIVNGGLGPTVDDLSQEVAAEAAGVGLVLDQAWLENIQRFYAARGRVMPPNNKKQAMLPAGSEFIDNPVGTACGFALNIGDARFFFTPGVPREIRKMLDDEIIPRLLKLSGTHVAVRLKRFHSFGLGESRVDDMLAGVEALATDVEVKLGFQAHYPELETKLFAQGPDLASLERMMAPVEAAVRERLGSHLLAEDNDTLESVILDAMATVNGTLAIAEAGTHGAVAGRIVASDLEGKIFRRGGLGGSVAALAIALELEAENASRETATQFAEAVMQSSKTSHGLAVLIPAGSEGGAGGGQGEVFIAIAREGAGTAVRASQMVGGRERVRAGGVEMGLDCLRRVLSGQKIDDKVDFERE